MYAKPGQGWETGRKDRKKYRHTAGLGRGWFRMLPAECQVDACADLGEDGMNVVCRPIECGCGGVVRCAADTVSGRGKIRRGALLELILKILWLQVNLRF